MAVRPAVDEATDGADIIMAAAVDEMTEKGYAATSVRSIAARAEMSVAALYYHFGSKADVLEKFMHAMHDRSLQTLSQAVAEAPVDDPAAQLSAVIRARIALATGPRGKQNATANTELRSLDPEARRRVVVKRDAIQAVFDGVLHRGVAAGLFRTPFPDDVAQAINVMTVGIVTWYRPDGPLTSEEVADRYVRMALMMAEYVGSPETQRTR